MKRKWLQISYSLALLISGLSFPTYAADGALQNTKAIVSKTEWMKGLLDTLPVCRISIPGTHDSGSIKGGVMLETQTLGIVEQLNQGIRAFDIRLQKKDAKLGVFHSHAFQEIYWESEVLPAFIHFLKAHPSETLIVSLKKEGGELADYSSLLSASLKNSVNAYYFVVDFRSDLRLKDCRGKILFFHRDRAMDDYPGAACTNWIDDATCLMTLRDRNGEEGHALLEDEYQYESGEGAGKKIEVCINNLDRVSEESVTLTRWGITFLSANGLPFGTPLVFANKVNKPVANHLMAGSKRNCGIVFIDFTGGQGGRKLVEYLINSNFN